MPRTALLSILALLLVAPSVLGGPAVPEPVAGEATVTAFTIRSNTASHDLEGGLREYTMVCVDCFLNLTVNSTGITVVKDGALVPLAPGVWQVREFAGTFSWSRVALRNYTFSLEGEGQVHRVA